MLELTKRLTKRKLGFLSDVASIVVSREKRRQLFHVSLYSNAFYLMFANALSAVCGFIFWIIAARFYPAEAVGLASAVIAAIGLLASFSNLGLGYGLIRFLPHSGEKADNLLNSSFTITVAAAILTALVFLGGLSLWSPALIFLRQEPLLIVAFVTFTIAFTINFVVSEAFVAERRAGFILAKEVIYNLLRLAMVVLLAGRFYSFGVYGSWGISLWVALFFSIFLFLPRIRAGYRPRPALNGETKSMIRFSISNYIANLLRGSSGLILPIIVINVMGAETNAYFYIAWAVSTALGTVAESASLSLFAEGSHDEQKLILNVRRSLKLVFLILIPVVVLVAVFTDKILLVFGSSYSDSAAALLRLLTIATLPLAVNAIYFSIKRVEQKMGVLIAATAFLTVATLALSYILLPVMGITGVGIAWLVSQASVTLVIGAGFLKGRLIRLSS